MEPVLQPQDVAAAQGAEEAFGPVLPEAARQGPLRCVSGSGDGIDLSMLRAELEAIVAEMDEGFQSVGTCLEAAVGKMGVVLQALRDITSPAAHEGNDPADSLLACANRLSDAPGQILGRETNGRSIAAAARSLKETVTECDRCLQALQIYGVNVKIASGGTAEFIEFADDMNRRLKAGTLDLEKLSANLGTLATSVHNLQQQDTLLLHECARIPPSVPQMLHENANALFGHYARMSGLAGLTMEAARIIEGDLASALCSIQIGDRARQRLEHVGLALRYLEEIGADPDLDPATVDGVQRHGLALQHAQIEETCEQFARDATTLLEALGRLGQSVAGLKNAQARQIGQSSAPGRAEGPGGAEGDQGEVLLRRIEAAVAAAQGMFDRIDEADAQADRTLRVILETAAEVSAHSRSIGSLRTNVRQMAINIGLRCRKAEGNGRAVNVVASEIRSRSEVLQEHVQAIQAVEASLADVAGQMRQGTAEQKEPTALTLHRSLEEIRATASRMEEAMVKVEDNASSLARDLEIGRSHLGDALAICGRLSIMADRLDAGKAELPCEEQFLPAHAPLQALLQRMATHYTMAEERLAHDRFLLPGMAPLNTGATEGEDEELFGSDDGLFGSDDDLFDATLF